MKAVACSGWHRVTWCKLCRPVKTYECTSRQLMGLAPPQTLSGGLGPLPGASVRKRGEAVRPYLRQRSRSFVRPDTVNSHPQTP